LKKLAALPLLDFPDTRPHRIKELAEVALKELSPLFEPYW
jgi:hypothetical protein